MFINFVSKGFTTKSTFEVTTENQTRPVNEMTQDVLLVLRNAVRLRRKLTFYCKVCNKFLQRIRNHMDRTQYQSLKQITHKAML